MQEKRCYAVQEKDLQQEGDGGVLFFFKRKFGAGISSVKFSAQRAELYCKAITHNVILCFHGLFERNLRKAKNS